jgi:hypothetical protein
MDMDEDEFIRWIEWTVNNDPETLAFLAKMDEEYGP